jgi:hypothetical protein
MLSGLAYLTLCHSIQLLALLLLARGDAAKDLEILVLPVAIQVLQRQRDQLTNRSSRCCGRCGALTAEQARPTINRHTDLHDHGRPSPAVGIAGDVVLQLQQVQPHLLTQHRFAHGGLSRLDGMAGVAVLRGCYVCQVAGKLLGLR